MAFSSRPGPRAMPRDGFDKSPLLAFYEVTQACDLACKHCRACAQTEAHPGELTTAESLRLIDQLAEFPKPPMLILTGGDPFKRADLFDLIEHAVGWGLDVSVTPSATPLVTRRALERLRESGVKRIAISIDGADAMAHDAVRCVPGSFERSLEILADARDAGLSTQVNTTLTPTNVRRIDALADLIAPLDIELWSVFFLVPVGRASAAPRLSPDEYEAAFARLWWHSLHQPYAVKTTAAPHYRRYAIQHQLPSGGRREKHPGPTAFVPLCLNDGKGILFVSHVGLVHPSGFMPILCGMFPLEHIVRIYQESPIFRGLRDAARLEGKCQICEFRNLCGGSRARAYAATDNPYAQEPDCSYVPRSR